MKFNYRPCPVCGFDISGSKPIIARDFPTHFVCGSCGFVFMSPIPETKDMEGYYRKDYWKEHHNIAGTVRMALDEDKVDRRSKAIFEWLRGFITTRTRVFEIGSGFGHTLAYIKSQANCSVYGLELSEEGVLNSTGSYGLQIFHGAWEDFSSKVGFFDVIIMSHVLEHFADVDFALSKVWENLRQDGLLFIEVPNILRPNGQKALRQWFSKEHISYFSKGKLSYFLAKCGFRIIRTEESHYLRVLATKTDKIVSNEIWNERSKVATALRKHEIKYFFNRILKKLKTL